MKDKFIRKTKEQLNRIALENLREDIVIKSMQMKVLVEAIKRERAKEVGNDKEVELVKVLREREATLLQHELDLEMVENFLKEYEDIEI